MTILITGATGQVGGAVARALATGGLHVRALIRSPDRAAGLDGVEIVQGSFEDDASLTRTLDGVEALFLTGRDSPDTVDQQRNVLKHAWRNGVRHVVKLSAIGANAESPVELMRDHHAIDTELLAGPADWTLLKPHLFMQNLTRAAETARVEGRLTAPMGDKRIPMVDTRDIGMAAAVILRDPASHAGKTYHLTGPETYSYYDVADALSHVVGRTVTYKPIPADELESQLLAAGVPGWRAFDLAHIVSAYDPRDHMISPDFETLVGHRPRTLITFLEDYRKIFAGSAPQ